MLVMVFVFLQDDVMHVIVRISVPVLTVKSGYALTGKVGKQPVRGNGLLAGNFSKKVSNSTLFFFFSYTLA